MDLGKLVGQSVVGEVLGVLKMLSNNVAYAGKMITESLNRLEERLGSIEAKLELGQTSASVEKASGRSRSETCVTHEGQENRKGVPSQDEVGR